MGLALETGSNWEEWASSWYDLPGPAQGELTTLGPPETFGVST